jgi:predicted amidophosphoribosyltransferase
MPDSILCDHCETLNELTRKACYRCAGPLFRNCKQCQAEVAASLQTCPHCGNDSGRAQRGSLRRILGSIFSARR